MDEAEMCQLFAEQLRLYAQRIRNNQTLGPFKGLLTGDATVNVQFNGSMLAMTAVEEPKKEVSEPKIEIVEEKPIRVSRRKLETVKEKTESEDSYSER